MDTSGPGLRQLFSSARGKQQELDRLDPRSEAYVENLTSAISELEECRQLISKHAVFSVNEEVEDVSTNDLQYLTVDYLLADLLLRSYGSNRANALQQVLELFESFLNRLDSYGILSADNKKLYERFLENRSSFTLASSTNVEDRRRIKVARFQQEKSLKAKLEVRSGLPKYPVAWLMSTVSTNKIGSQSCGR